jgi:tetratricopeptide (TPR) repeat protein
VKIIEKIEKLLHDSNSIEREEVALLDEITSKYPYYQTGQILLAKGLLNINSIRYNKQLRKCAAYSINRKKLFELIVLENRKKNKIKSKKNELKIDLNIGEPIMFNNQEHHSFSEWLTLSKIKKIKRSENETTPFENLKEKIKNNTVKKTEFFKPVSNAKESLIENLRIVTPTLARVYLEQGHYEKAISAYKELILKYPKKSSLFAEKIKLINKLKKI